MYENIFAKILRLFLAFRLKIYLVPPSSFKDPENVDKQVDDIQVQVDSCKDVLFW